MALKLENQQRAAIKADNITKCYQVYAKPFDRLRQAFGARVRKVLRLPPKKYFEEFWALSGVSLQLSRGQTVGIIGRNGSGKSTFLQILCGTLSPTGGSVEVDGRVAALLELGSGFNPEFTGRENVYLNAAVLGLERETVDKRFKEIEVFADIGDFIDQPVKTYSSGMAVRLAFAVIAHVDADILVVDEALAVGDAAFSQKCMRFLREFRKNGTVLFVSHDAASILSLCDHAVWLDHGQLRLQGTPVDVSNAYTQFIAQEVYGDSLKLRAIRRVDNATDERQSIKRAPAETVQIFDNIANSDGWDTGSAEIVSVSLANLTRKNMSIFGGGERVELLVLARSAESLGSVIIGFFVKDRLGQALFGEHTYTYQPGFAVKSNETIEARFVFVLPMLPDGDYSMTVSVADGDPAVHVQHHWLHDAVRIRVASPVLRYGLVGIPFESVTLAVESD